MVEAHIITGMGKETTKDEEHKDDKFIGELSRLMCEAPLPLTTHKPLV